MSGLVRMAIDRYVNLVDSISGEQCPNSAVTEERVRCGSEQAAASVFGANSQKPSCWYVLLAWI